MQQDGEGNTQAITVNKDLPAVKLPTMAETKAVDSGIVPIEEETIQLSPKEEALATLARLSEVKAQIARGDIPESGLEVGYDLIGSYCPEVNTSQRDDLAKELSEEVMKCISAAKGNTTEYDESRITELMYEIGRIDASLPKKVSYSAPDRTPTSWKSRGSQDAYGSSQGYDQDRERTPKSRICKVLKDKGLRFTTGYRPREVPRRVFAFYIRETQVLIEFDREYCFNVNSKYHNGSQESLDKRQIINRYKTQTALDNGYNVIRIDYCSTDSIEDFLETALDRRGLSLSNEAIYSNWNRGGINDKLSTKDLADYRRF